MQDLIRPDASFTPRELFARMQGAWFEPRIGSMWQENTGVTPTTTGGQTIGLLVGLDQQQQLGPNLVTVCDNGTFISGIAGITSINATIASDNSIFPSGGLKVTSTTGGQARAYIQTLSMTPGRSYRVTCDMYSPSSNTQIMVGTVNFNVAGGYEGAFVSVEDAVQSRSYIFVATASSHTLYVHTLHIGVAWGAVGDSVYIDNISVREMLGNHAFQATAANRPTLQYNGNLPLIRHADSTDVLVAAMPDLGGGVFSSAGSVYFATPQGMSCLHNQSIGTTYNLPALQTDIYGTVITPARLAPPLEQRLALYMHRLAGLADADFFWQEQATDGMTGQLLTDDGTILLRG